MVDSRSTILIFVGGWGNVAGSGVRWKIMFGFLGSSTDIDADQDVSPLSEDAVQVYNPVSSAFKSENICLRNCYIVKALLLLSIFREPVPLMVILGSY